MIPNTQYTKKKLKEEILNIIIDSTIFFCNFNFPDILLLQSACDTLFQ